MAQVKITIAMSKKEALKALHPALAKLVAADQFKIASIDCPTYSDTITFMIFELNDNEGEKDGE